MNKPELISWIIQVEWEFFSSANNMGGRASCQEDPETFALMRCAQFDAWDEDSLLCYKETLTQASKEGRNLVAEKYAHMMAFTAPLDYFGVMHMIRLPSEEEKALSQSINEILVRQTVECAAKYPHVMSLGRPIHACQDSTHVVSSETYMLGELYTYGEATLKALYKHITALQNQGISYVELIQENTAQGKGYASLAAADAAVAAR